MRLQVSLRRTTAEHTQPKCVFMWPEGHTETMVLPHHNKTLTHSCCCAKWTKCVGVGHAPAMQQPPSWTGMQGTDGAREWKVWCAWKNQAISNRHTGNFATAMIHSKYATQGLCNTAENLL